ncbi:unnamed protein product [Ambrosiozyma monospora]|uniref:Unnamed protein product n=1 Tax=Ambrosiozyma monospora TaxID=43982 RepID=A0A9W6Z5G8_AMBMO|nr:unnamed protein product [Ambrosiozyma monospora]
MKMEQQTARIKYHQSGKFLASAHYDNTWKLWDLTKLVPSSSSPPLLYEQEGHYTNSPFTLAWHPDGALLGTGGLDGIIKIWDLRSGMNVLNFGGVLPVSHPSTFVDATGATTDNTKSTSTATTTAYAHAKAIHSIQFRTNGYELLSGSADSLIKVWDLRSAKPPPPPPPPSTHQQTNSYSNWEMATGWGTRGSVGSTSAGFKTDVGLHTGAVTDLVLGYGGNGIGKGNDDSFFVSCGYDGVLNVVDCDSWRVLKKFDVGTKIMSCDVCFDEDGEGVKIVCGGWDRGVKLFTL